MTTMAKKILVCDIGGTSSRFGLFSLDTQVDSLRLIDTHWHKTRQLNSFKELLAEIDSSSLEVDTRSADVMVFAVAGPVIDSSRCSPPNIDWSIDLDDYSDRLTRENVILVNDFVAQAFAVLGKLGREAEVVSTGVSANGAPIAVVGAGTGLGKALLQPTHGTYVAVPSEGGHTNFCAETEAEFAFSQFAIERLGQGYLVWDKVTSGYGLQLLHEYLSGEELAAEEISERYLSDQFCPTFLWFSRFYGRVCRNYVLETMALGGLYIAGGVAAKNPDIVRSQEFLDSFCSSAKYGDVLSRVPIKLQGNEEAGLWGAARIGEFFLRG
jgi:glucokinase